MGVLRSVGLAPDGVAESVGPLSLGAGTYFIRVQSSGREGSAIDHVQLYDLDVVVD